MYVMTHELRVALCDGIAEEDWPEDVVTRHLEAIGALADGDLIPTTDDLEDEAEEDTEFSVQLDVAFFGLHHMASAVRPTEAKLHVAEDGESAVLVFVNDDTNWCCAVELSAMQLLAVQENLGSVIRYDDE